MSRFRRALVVGKFAPLHRGHQLVINRARAEADQLYLISYCNPERPGCPPTTRAEWLRALYPDAHRLVVSAESALADLRLPADAAPDEEHRRFVAALCLRHFGTTVDAVYTSETYGAGFARTLSEEFRRVHPDAPAVVHVQVDQARAIVPISATAIRADPHAHRAYLDPRVYAAFVARICLLGGESSGKSTLAAALAEACATTYAPEYGRTLWEQKAGALAYDDLLAIARRQVATEEAAALGAHRFVFCDTSPLTTWFYCRALFGRTDPALDELARRPYALTVLCAPDFPFVQDGTRRDAGFRAEQDAFYRRRLAEIGAPFMIAAGPLPDRIAAVRTRLAAL